MSQKKKPKRASVGMQYTITLEAGDGKQWEWPITDCYFDRRMEKIKREMLEVIREHDLSYEFSL